MMLSLLDDQQFYNIQILEKTTSTNDVLKEMAQSGAPEGTVVIAKEQTAGKGRKGRSFFSPADTGLYMSILLRPRFSLRDTALLTPMTAVAVVNAIEMVTKKRADIKWVNDVFMGGKKVCGILAEASVAPDGTSMDYVIIGIGVNLFEPNNGFPEDLKGIAGFLCENDADLRSSLAAEILNQFHKLYLRFENKEFLSEYKNHLFFLGNEIGIVTNKGTEYCVALDITEDCHLLVQMKDGSLRELDSGEISIKP